MKEYFDFNEDGDITEEEIDKVIKMKRNKLKIDIMKDQSRMAWFALYCMGMYPLLILISSAFGYNDAANLLSDITGVYFGSIAVVVAAFMGSEAYAVRRDDKNDI